MHKLPYREMVYRTAAAPAPLVAKMLPSFSFYLRLIAIILRSGRTAKAGGYTDSMWVDDSFEVLRKLEQVGIQVEITGIDNVTAHDGPVVFIGNHMSMMETMVLPVVIQPVKPVTFVVKESLLTYPVFQHIMRARNPVAVTRTNPRQDLKIVLTEGQERLARGISVIVFPQTTRSHEFSPDQMSSIGVKLAKKAEVPVVPVALKTDCWQNGRLLKDMGRLAPQKKAYFSFGEPIYRVEGKGDEEQSRVNSFIVGELRKWGNIVQPAGQGVS